MPRALADSTLEHLDDLPPFEQDAVEIQGLVDVLSREVDRLDGSLQGLLDSIFPQNAGPYVELWEELLGLSIAPADLTLAERVDLIVANLQRLKASASGVSWHDNIARLLGSDWQYSEHDPAVPTSPPANTIYITLPWSTALNAPTGLAETVLPSGGALAAGTYYYVVTALNAYGETMPSAEVSATVAANGRVSLSWDAVSGATGYRVYRGTASTQEKLIATVAANNYIDAGGQPASLQGPPGTDTTESAQTYSARLLARRITPAHLDLVYVFGDSFIVGVSNIGFQGI